MNARLSWLCLVLLLSLGANARAQVGLPLRVQIEPLVAPSHTGGDLIPEDWTMLYGGRLAMTLTPRTLLYIGYWPRQTVHSFREPDFGQETTKFSQWSAGFRLLGPLAPEDGMFGTLNLGVSNLKRAREFESGGFEGTTEERWWGVNLGAHIDYWVARFVGLRGGIDGTYPFLRGNDVDTPGGVLSFEFGVVLVPVRW